MSLLSKAENESEFRFLKNGLIEVDHAVIIWTNFRGLPTRFNKNGGKRSFTLVLPREVADRLSDDGWNIKERPPRDEDGDPLIYTEIIVNPAGRSFKAFKTRELSNGKKQLIRLDEDSIGSLDVIDIENIDLVINPFHHENSDKYCYKGYVNEIYVTQERSGAFGGRYADYEIVEDNYTPATVTDDNEEGLPFN